MVRCSRCGGETLSLIGSFFNKDLLCLICRAIEETHPDFERARRQENEAVRRGDYNFAGVGLPSGYREWARERREQLVEAGS